MQALAAVLRQSQEPLRIETVEVLPPGPGEVQVRMQAAGVCHSDLHVMKGDLPMKTPIILGHEGAGIVEAIGKGVTSVEPGDHIIPIWRMSCGRCGYCLSGRPALCDVGTAMRFTGLMPDGQTRFRDAAGQSILHYAGVSTFSQLSTMPEGAVVKIPRDVSFEHAALIGCGVITGYGAVMNAASVAPGSSVAVWGAGGIGLNVIQTARLAGATTIVAVDRVPLKLDYARRLGATHAVNAGEADPVEAVKDLTGGLGADYTFEAVGLPEPIEQAYDATRKGGTCVVVGISPPSARARINVNALVYAEKTLKGSIYGSTRPRIDLLRLIDLHRAGRIDLDTLLTRTYPLSQINEAYDALERGEVARSLVLPQA
ncbi:MAG: Zn-dependent alcohol dehydrogenase [Verrucomicrobiales bacterium]|nr:Zn-dependent alcohol dehydrogenase [Verrucomicrobiales bacterium]